MRSVQKLSRIQIKGESCTMLRFRCAQQLVESWLGSVIGKLFFFILVLANREQANTNWKSMSEHQRKQFLSENHHLSGEDKIGFSFLHASFSVHRPISLQLMHFHLPCRKDRAS